MSSTTIMSILALYVSLIYVVIGSLIGSLMHLDTISKDDLVDAGLKFFVAMCFTTHVMTAFLEGLRKRHFVNQTANKNVQPTSRPVDEPNATSTADALVADFDLVAKIKRELDRDFDHQIALELELDLDHARRRELELELQVELKRKTTPDAVAAVTTVNSDSTADFLSKQQRAIQDALGDSSARITWGELGSASNTDSAAGFDVAGEVENALRSELELELELELILEMHYNSKCPVARKKERQQHLGSRLYALGNGR